MAHSHEFLPNKLSAGTETLDPIVELEQMWPHLVQT